MRHIPHLVVPGPWSGDQLAIDPSQREHLFKVLRSKPSDPVTYTDGKGAIGTGALTSDETVLRAEETTVTRPSGTIVAAAPPANRDRQRFLVEKLAELGAEELVWLRTRHGIGRVAAKAKLTAWARSGLEQSRGAWEMVVSDRLADWPELASPLMVCQPGGDPVPIQARTVVIGPERGLEGDEIPPEAATWDLGPTLLRVETAAIVAFSRLVAKI